MISLRSLISRSVASALSSIRQRSGLTWCASPMVSRQSVRCFARRAPQSDDTIFPGVPLKLTVKLGPAIGIHLPLDRLVDVVISAWPEFQRHQILGTSTHSFADIITGDHQVGTVLRNAPDDNVQMRVCGVPVIDGDPVEFRAEIGLHLPHQIPRESPQIRHLRCVLRRDNKAEMVAVAIASFREV